MPGKQQMSRGKHLPKLQLVGVCLRPDLRLICSKSKQRGFDGAAALLGISLNYSGLACSGAADRAQALQPVLMDTLSCVGRVGMPGPPAPPVMSELLRAACGSEYMLALNMWMGAPPDLTRSVTTPKRR